MGGLNYGGLIEAWKVSLIEVRARTYGFIEDDIPDLKQQIVFELINADFTPGLSGGAEEKTFVIGLIDRQLNKTLRDRKRNVRRANYEADIFEEEVVDQHSFFIADESERTNLRIDLETVISDLSASEIIICVGLMQGNSQAEIARAMGQSTSEVSRLMARLRDKLKKWGLDN